MKKIYFIWRYHRLGDCSGSCYKRKFKFELAGAW